MTCWSGQRRWRTATPSPRSIGGNSGGCLGWSCESGRVREAARATKEGFGAKGSRVLTPCPPLPSGEGELTTSPRSGTERGTGGEDSRRSGGEVERSQLDALFRDH